nr:hypothetical protein [Salmonella enterica]
MGIRGRIKSESAIGLHRNQWSVWVGIRKRDVTTRSDDNFYYYAPPLARNAFPATPARLAGYF